MSGLWASTLRLAAPYLYAALGETIGQRSGVLNLGVEGVMLGGAYAAFWCSWKTGHPWLGVLAAALTGLVMGLVMALVSVTWKAEQGLSGIGLYLLGLGLSSLLFEVQVGQVQQVQGCPSLIGLAYVLVPLTWLLLSRTRFGLLLKAVGENPEAADACGISVDRVRYQAVCLGSVLAALGGASLSLGVLDFFQEHVTNGIGFIAVALVYFGAWSPWGVLAGALLFSFVNSLQLWAQIEKVPISTDLVVMLPYVLTIVSLAIVGQRRSEPAALGLAYQRSGWRPRGLNPRLLAALAAVIVLGPQTFQHRPGAAPTARIAVILPGIRRDLSWSQSLDSSLQRLQAQRPGLQVDYSEGMFNMVDASNAIRAYASRGFDLVIAHGSQYGNSVLEIAREYPKVSFAYGTSTDTGGRANVFAYNAQAQQGGYLEGMLAARLSKTRIVGMVGPIEAGDAKLYTDGFVKGAAGVKVNITYTGSFTDTALASEAAYVQLQAGADVLTGSAQQVAGAISVARKRGVYWLATQNEQTALAPEVEVAAQVYDWTSTLEEMLDLRQSGTLGGRALELTLANGGLRLVYNPAVALPPGLTDQVAQALADIEAGKLLP